MSQNSNSLTIDEVTDYLTTEHAARLLVAECWYTLVPRGDNHPLSYRMSGDSAPFWALVNKVQSMGQPLGWNTTIDHMGDPMKVPHKDPETLLRKLIKVEVRDEQGNLIERPNFDMVAERAIDAGKDPKQEFERRMNHYNARLQAAEQKVNNVVKQIMAQQKMDPNDIAAAQGDLIRQVEVLDEEGNVIDYEDQYVTGGEWEIPIDRIIEFGEKQISFMANNQRIKDTNYIAEKLIWKDEIAKLTAIVHRNFEHEGSGESSREIDDQLLSAGGMAAGMNSGK